jgi:hypothetical protein
MVISKLDILMAQRILSHMDYNFGKKMLDSNKRVFLILKK